jgi:Family of unknown function (DUF5313)
MTRLPGNPGPAGWVLFALGFRLRARNREWVRHELTDAGWRGRTVIRHLVLMVPVCVALAFLPGPPWLRVMVPALALLGSLFTVTVHADSLRTARLRQHRIPVPGDRVPGDSLPGGPGRPFH